MVVVAEWSGRYQEGGETEGQRCAVTGGGAERRGEVSTGSQTAADRLVRLDLVLLREGR
jgi:hypothetical protein